MEGFEEDSYLTIAQPSEGLFTDRGSKFHSYAFPIQSAQEAKDLLSEFKSKYATARHHCLAYSIGFRQPETRASDDGEPSGSAGKPILGQILSHNLNNVVIIVVRYFGGTKLGVPGLINAYKMAAQSAIENGQIITAYESKDFIIQFDYAQMPQIMDWAKKSPLEIIHKSFNLSCTLTVQIRIKFLNETLETFPGNKNQLEQIP